MIIIDMTSVLWHAIPLAGEGVSYLESQDRLPDLTGSGVFIHFRKPRYKKGCPDPDRAQ